MFEAGFFGTIEDLFLGAKGGVENMGRNVGEFFNSGKSKDEDCTGNVTVLERDISAAKRILPEYINILVINKDPDRSNISGLLESIFDISKKPDGLMAFIRDGMGRLLHDKNGENEIVMLISKEYPNIKKDQILSIVISDINNYGWKKKEMSDTDFVKGLQKNPLQYFEMSDDVKNIISDIDSGKISPEKGFEIFKQLPDPNIVLDMRKLINDADSFMKAMKAEVPESISEMPVKSDTDKEKDTVTLEEAITSTESGNGFSQEWKKHQQ